MREVDVIAWSKEEVTRKEKEKRGAERKGDEKRGEERRKGGGEERRSEKKREKKRGESRPIRAPRQGDLCLIRRSRLAEAVQTGIHIRYGPGSCCTLVLIFLVQLRHSFHKLLQFANTAAFLHFTLNLYVNSISIAALPLIFCINRKTRLWILDMDLRYKIKLQMFLSIRKYRIDIEMCMYGIH